MVATTERVGRKGRGDLQESGVIHMTVEEYLKFLGIKDERLDKMSKEKRQEVMEELLYRLRYFFIKDVKKELDYVLDNISK